MARLDYEKRNKIELGAKGEVFNRKQKNDKYNSHGKAKKSNKNAKNLKRTYLNVPFNEKDEAKLKGAKWDAKRKKWFCVGQVSSFRKWINPRSS
jgi:hypothetical protein